MNKALVGYFVVMLVVMALAISRTIKAAGHNHNPKTDQTSGVYVPYKVDTVPVPTEAIHVVAISKVAGTPMVTTLCHDTIVGDQHRKEKLCHDVLLLDTFKLIEGTK